MSILHPLVLVSCLIFFFRFLWQLLMRRIQIWTQPLRDPDPVMANTALGECSSTSGAPNSTPIGTYDVFLSFRGLDTRLNFTDHLYHALNRSGLTAFRDDEELSKGEVLSPQLIQAIENSRFAVVVLSQNYADSKWCLNELQQILGSMPGRAFPIFYNVDPSDVRHQTNSFGEALAKLEKEVGGNKTEKVQIWKNSLSEIGKITGWDTRGRPDKEVIEEVVRYVRKCLCSKLPPYDDNLVGIERRMVDLMSCLEIDELDNIRFVGIWGMGGSGKTTLARVVYEEISNRFEMCCFLDNVRETLQKEGLVSLQKRLLSQLGMKEEIHDDRKRMEMIRIHFCKKKVLLVIDDLDDDLDDVSQLEELAGSQDCFGKGSRIIITTRNKRMLNSCEGKIYEMKAMEEHEALRLFSKKAFKKDHPEEDYLELSKSVVAYAGGLPLALKVLGSFLWGRKKDEWADTLDKLKQIPNDKILQILKISYDGLDEKEKTIFLDIACLFRNWRKDVVTQVLIGCDLNPKIGISVLIEKALLVEAKDILGDTLEMHDLLQEFGRDIIRQESPNNGCNRSRMWKLEDIIEVLENKVGSEAIQVIVMRGWYGMLHKVNVHLEAFSKMKNIRLLIIDDRSQMLILPRELKFSSALKVVRWRGFPLETLPLPLNKLVHIEMPYSQIKQLWNGRQSTEKLKHIDLSNSLNLIETPDFSRVPNLKHLNVKGCESLVKVHPSLGELKRLVEINLSCCSNLKNLPRKLETNSLERFYLYYCGEVAVLPEFGEGMKNLSYLDVSCTTITTLPESLGSLTGLRHLDLGCCEIFDLDKLKTLITRQISSLNVTSLTELYLNGCCLDDGSLDNFGSLSSLTALDLSGNFFVNLPTGCFSGLFQLLYLFLDDCYELKSLPRLPPRLIRLSAAGCVLIEPLSNRQLWNLVASRDHENRGRIEYENTNTNEIERHDEDDYHEIFMIEDVKSECLPQRDFIAIVPGGCKIPSWCTSKEYYWRKRQHCEIKVDIPQSFHASEWFGIVVFLEFVSSEYGKIWWSSKGAEDDDYICKEWAHVLDPTKHDDDDDETHPQMCMMVLELNEKTCWQHLTPPNNSLHILLATFDGADICEVEIWGYGWRLISKEEIQECSRLNDHFTLPPTPQQVVLSQRLLHRAVYYTCFN